MNKILPINIQYLAEDGKNGSGAEQTPQTEQGTENTKQNEQQAGKKPEKSEKLYTQEDVDNLLNKRFDEWSKKRNAEVDEAKKLANMNENEKTAYERDKLRKELDEYKARDQLAQMSKTARGMLSEVGITVPDELLAVMVTTDAEKTKSAVTSFSKLFNESVEKAVKDHLKGTPPKAGAKTGGTAMTVDKIMAIKDPVERQQAIIDNKELFNI